MSVNKVTSEAAHNFTGFTQITWKKPVRTRTYIKPLNWFSVAAVTATEPPANAKLATNVS